MLVVAAALLVLWLSASPAFAQDGDNVQYSAVCQNILGAIDDLTAIQDGEANAAATQYGEAAAVVAQEQGVTIAQVNECLNSFGGKDFGGKDFGGKDLDKVGSDEEGKFKKGVLSDTIPKQVVLADTGGVPLIGLAVIGLGMIAAGASLFRFGGWR